LTAFAASRNKDFMDLMRFGARSFRLDLSAREAKVWGLGGKAGTYAVAVGQDGKSVFVDEKSGHPSSVGHLAEAAHRLSNMTNMGSR